MILLNHFLNSQEEILVFIEYNYTAAGDKIVTATAISGTFEIKGGF